LKVNTGTLMVVMHLFSEIADGVDVPHSLVQEYREQQREL